MPEAPPAYAAVPTNAAGYPTVPGFDHGQPPVQTAYQPPGASVYVVGQPQTTVVHVVGRGVGPEPSRMQCPGCGQDVISRTTHNAGLLTWLLVGGLMVIGCWLGCCLIPCCVDGCQDVSHSCPNCNNHLGVYRRCG